MIANPEPAEGLAKLDKGEVALADAKVRVRELMAAELAALQPAKVA